MSIVEDLKDIKAEMQQRIANHLGSAVNQVIVGPKDQAFKFRPPLIWVLPETGSMDNAGARAIHEDWYLLYWIVGIVQSHKGPEEATEEAEQLAVKASAALLKDPTTGEQDRTLGNRVHYIKRIGWAPGDTRIVENETLYGAGVQIQVRYETEEVE